MLKKVFIKTVAKQINFLGQMLEKHALFQNLLLCVKTQEILQSKSQSNAK